tara:strand:- start:360 stop:1268 length:909 start_codon:yes stop_codon:yes gene_type:complete
MKKLILLLVFIPLISFSQSFLPESNGQLISHKYFSLSYSEKHEQAEWVHYKLTFPMINGSTKRKDNFKKDSKVKTGSASNSDYYKSGFDRGHLAPAGDMKLNSTMMSESFYMSNISPQRASFNRGGWKKLEDLVRSWASYKTLYVTVAGVLNDNNLINIGSNNVTVPSRFYKIIFDPNQNKVIAFVMPNTKISGELSDYVVTVDVIENITGIDFLSELEDAIEDRIESKIDIYGWNFNQKGVNKNYKKYSNYDTASREQNKVKTLKKSESNIVVRCTAITLKGAQCKRNASSGSTFCWQHKK